MVPMHLKHFLEYKLSVPTLLGRIFFHRIRIWLTLVSKVPKDLLYFLHVKDGQGKKDDLSRVGSIFVL